MAGAAQALPSLPDLPRRFQHWVRSGAFQKALRRLARRLHAEGRLDLSEAFIDATFVAAKKGALPSALPSEARGRRSRLSPLATVFLSPSVPRLLRHTKVSSSRKRSASFLDQLPERMIGDKAYDSDALDRCLERSYGISK